MFLMSIDFFTGSRFFPKACNFSKRRDRTHTRTQKARVPEEAEIGVFPTSIDFFTDSPFFPKACNFSKRRDRTHTRTQKETVPEEAEIGVFSMSFDFFTRPQGARTPDYPRHANPGLRPHTPPVKNIPGGPPPPSN